jgi:hypothetical protein
MKHFFGYQHHPDYLEPVENETDFTATLTDEERKILKIPDMRLGNIAWRRRYLSMAANRKKFPQEFPATPEEAFMTTGRSPFDRAMIRDWVIRKPLETKMEGRLLYWVKPIPEHRYILSVDTASGRGVESLDQADAKEGGTDYDVLQVWDCQTWQMVAMFRGKWPYAKLHEVAFPLAKEFNNAYVVIEATDHGLTVINNFVRDYIDRGLYPRTLMHSTRYEDEKSKKMASKWGFYTNLKTRPLILDNLAEAILDAEIVCYSAKVQSECLRFIIDDNGDQHAMEGYHDDTVMAAAIGIYNIPLALKAVREAVSKKDLGLR